MKGFYPMESSFEKLGVFYLGKTKADNNLLLYDSKDLVTHAVCVGMTGSGKTGLCINLLEEAAIDAIPAIIIDPKGDLCNLLLTFPNLAPEDLRRGSRKVSTRLNRHNSGRKDSPSGERTANALSACETPLTSASTRRAAMQDCLSRFSSRSSLPPNRLGKTTKHLPSALTRPSRACWR